MIVWIAALIMAVVMTGITTLFNYLTVVAAEAPNCAGREILNGIRVGILDIWLLSFVSMLCTLMLASLGKSEKLNNLVREGYLPVFELAGVRIAEGLAFVCSIIFVMLVGLGLITTVIVSRYNAIAKYCSAATSVAPPNGDDDRFAVRPPVR